MNKTMKRSLAVLLAVLMLLSVCASQFAFAATAIGKVETLKVASVTQSQVKLKWSKVSKASGYCVYSYDAKKDQWLVETYTTANTFTDKGLSAGTKYTYKVAAYVKTGTTRTFGKDSAKADALTLPARVGKLTAKQVTPAKIKLTWSAAAGATGYLLYGSLSGGARRGVLQGPRLCKKRQDHPLCRQVQSDSQGEHKAGPGGKPDCDQHHRRNRNAQMGGRGRRIGIYHL